MTSSGEFVKPDEHLLADGCHIFGRHFTPSSFVKDPDLGRCRKWKASRNSKAIIVRCASQQRINTYFVEARKRDPGLACEKFHVVMGDELHAKTLAIYYTGRANLKTTHVSAVSATHGSQVIQTDDFTRVSVVIPFQHIMSSIADREALLGDGPAENI